MKTHSKKIKTIEELNAFSNSKLNKTMPQQLAETKKQILPITIYDFNGSLSQYGHLMEFFLDKNALIIICIDSTSFNLHEEDNNDNINKADEIEKNLSDLLDLIFMRMSKTTSFMILPVLTKCDHMGGGSQSVLTKLMCQKIEDFMHTYLRTKLEQIKVELKKIESLAHITASQSDKLKQLAQAQTNLNPDIYKQCLPVCSVKMLGIEALAVAIKDIVLGGGGVSKKYFPDVNKKVPVFWTEVENYACNKIAEMSNTWLLGEGGNNNKQQRTSSNQQQQQSIKMFCVDYEEYKVIENRIKLKKVRVL